MLEKEKLSDECLEVFWKPIQEMTPVRIHNNIPGSKDFFEWFKEFDLKSSEYNASTYRNLYYKLPYSISKVYEELCNKIGIKIRQRTFRKNNK